MTGVGAIFLPSRTPEELRGVAIAADEAGLQQLWLWEDCFKEGAVSSMAAALAWTSRLRVGIGLMPVPMRNVATVAMEAATVERLFPGRPIIGVGHGVLPWMGQIGARVGSPLTLLGEHLDALRSLLAGQEATVDGRYVHLDRVRLDHPPAIMPRILAGAEGPKTLALAGAKADGIILPGGTTPQGLHDAVATAQHARAAAGITGPLEVVVFVPAVSGPDAEDRLHADLKDWNLSQDPDHGVHGEAEAIADGLRRWIDAGATTVVLQPDRLDPEPERTVRFVGEQVQPLLA